MLYIVSYKHQLLHTINFYKNCLVKLLHHKLILASNLKHDCELNLGYGIKSSSTHQNEQLSQLNQQLLSVNRFLRLGFSLRQYLTLLGQAFTNSVVELQAQTQSQTSKRLSKIALMLLILLPYSANTQALLTSTVQVINGSKPYLTFDNGITKITTTDSLLGISLSNGTRITPETNTSVITPIVLPHADETLADVQMLIPPSINSISLNTLISAPYNYWGDDDGDGQGSEGISASGSLSVSITDNNDQAVSRSDKLDICKAPYKVTLTSIDGSLTTEYGVPNSSNFSNSSATYYINPKAEPTICYARPNLSMGTGLYVGPTDIWKEYKGFLVPSIKSSSYDRNFPTTGANGLYFDLLVSDNIGHLTWPTVTMGGITATMTLNPPQNKYFNTDGTSSVRVTLTGPVATDDQHESSSPSPISKPSLPQTFELVGYDSNNSAVVKYGFVLKQWFVTRGNKGATPTNHSSWCSSLGGYHLPKVKDLTNSYGSFWVGGTPSSTSNRYQRNIGAGLFTEWGAIFNYTDAGFVNHYYWTSDTSSTYQFAVNSLHGSVHRHDPPNIYYGVCSYP